MALINPDLGLKLIFLLGIINILSIVLVFFSCRCLMGKRLGNWLQKYPKYLKFYQKHCYFWWLFVISVFFHTLLAFLIFGSPF